MKQNQFIAAPVLSLGVVCAVTLFSLSTVYALKVGASGNATTEVEIPAGGESNASAQNKAAAVITLEEGAGNSSTSATAVGDLGNVSVVVITRADIDGDATLSASASPETVRAEVDISPYVAAQMAADTNVSKVESSKSRVSVTYPQHVKLFGFVPITVDATATVLADGTVDVRYPWFAFLMVTDEAELESEIESRLRTFPSLGLNASADESLELSARAQAELIETVRAAMENSLEAEAAVSAAL